MGSFSLDMRAFADKVKTRNNLVVKKIVIDVGTALVLKSPVGDANYWQSPAPAGYVGGRFRANWQYGLDAADRTITEKTDKTGSTTITGLSGSVGKQASGHRHYLTNSLAYGPRLENGWSRQAPHGMVKLTMLEFQPIVNAAAQAIRASS